MIGPETLKTFLDHPDEGVREEVAEYFGDSWSLDPEIAPAIVRAVRRLGDTPGQRLLRSCEHLVIDAACADLLMEDLGQAESPSTRSAIGRLILRAPIDYLREHREAIEGAPAFPPDLVPSLNRRIAYDGWTADRLWKELRTSSAAADADPDHDLEHTDDLVEALAAHETPGAADLVAMLESEEYLDTWLEILLVELAGARRLREAVPAIVRKLAIDADVLREEAVEALARIGDPEACRLIAAAWPGQPDHVRFYASEVLARVKGPEGEAAILGLLESEEDETVRTMLVRGLCQQFSDRAVEAVTREIERGYDETYTTLEHDLVPVADVLGVDLPRADAWRAEREQSRSKFRRMMEDWQAEAESEGPDEGEEEEGEFEEGNGQPIVYEEARVGRNDPCPCGSGKKFKKCCGRPA